MCATCDETSESVTTRNWYGVDLEAWVRAALSSKSMGRAMLTKILVPMSNGTVMAISLAPVCIALDNVLSRD